MEPVDDPMIGVDDDWVEIIARGDSVFQMRCVSVVDIGSRVEREVLYYGEEF